MINHRSDRVTGLELAAVGGAEELLRFLVDLGDVARVVSMMRWGMGEQVGGGWDPLRRAVLTGSGGTMTMPRSPGHRSGTAPSACSRVAHAALAGSYLHSRLSGCSCIGSRLASDTSCRARQLGDHAVMTPSQPPNGGTFTMMKGKHAWLKWPGFSRTVRCEISGEDRIGDQFSQPPSGGSCGGPRGVIKIVAVGLGSRSLALPGGASPCAREELRRCGWLEAWGGCAAVPVRRRVYAVK